MLWRYLLFNTPTEGEKLYPVFAHFLNAQEFMWKMYSKNNCGKSFSQKHIPY